MKATFTKITVFGIFISAFLLRADSLVLAGDTTKRPNVILIMADDMGYETLQCNGGTSYKTPTFDRLASKAMRFTRCYSQPICTPSRNKIMTGRSNARNYRAFGVLDKHEITFGSLMKNAGYRTAIAGKWQLTGGSKGGSTYGWGTTPSRCGFEASCMWAYERDITPEQADAYFAKLPPGTKRKTSRFWYPSIIENDEWKSTNLSDYGPDLYCRFLLDFVEEHREEPFFVYYPMALTHNPFVPTPESPAHDDKAKFSSDPIHFGDMIRYTGRIVERFLTRLDELGIADHTLVLFTADNGTHRTITSRMNDRIIVGGKGLPLDAGVHVPMMAWWKGTIPAGSECHDLIEFSDFLPTIVDAGGGKLPDDRTIDGKSFLPRLKGEPHKARDSIFVHYDKSPDSDTPEFRRVRFAFDGRYKLYLDGTMYEVPRDREEEHPITSSDSRDAAAARVRLQRVLDAMPPWEPDNSIFRGGPDQETQERTNKLRELTFFDQANRERDAPRGTLNASTVGGRVTR